MPNVTPTQTKTALLDKLHITDSNAGASFGADGVDCRAGRPSAAVAQSGDRRDDRVGVARVGRRLRSRDRRSRARVRVVAGTSRAQTRRPRARPGHRAPRGERTAGRSRVARDGQDSRGRPRRSAGDDRHLRLCCRLVAPVVRIDAGLRAARAPHDGAVAPTRSRRCHYGIQFSRRRLGVERGHCRSVRRPGRLEAGRGHAALRDRRAAHCESRHGAITASRASSDSSSDRAVSSASRC